MNEVPLNLIPDEYRSKEVPLGMLPDEMKPKKGLVGRTLDKVFPPLPYLFGQREEPQGVPAQVVPDSELPKELAISHTLATRTPYPSTPSFDPEGAGYDLESAQKTGLKPDKTGHLPSRDPITGLILKGRTHETWPLTVEGEKKAGYEMYKGEDGRYYSKPIEKLYPTVGEGYDPFRPSMKLAEVRRKRSEEARKRVRAKGEQIKTGEPGLWTAPSPPVGEGFIPFLGTIEKRLTGEKEWGSPETLMEPGFEVAQMYVGGKVIGGVFNAIKGSAWFRMLTNKQRGLITQTVDDMLRARKVNLDLAQKKVAERLGPAPREKDYVTEEKWAISNKRYQDRNADLLKDYKITPTEGDIARTVESYREKFLGVKPRPIEPKIEVPPTVEPLKPAPVAKVPEVTKPIIEAKPEVPREMVPAEHKLEVAPPGAKVEGVERGEYRKITDAKTGEKLEDFELGKTRELVESKRRLEERKAEIAKLPDVKGKEITPTTTGKIDTPKAQKTYLLDAIEKAIKEAPEAVEPVRTGFEGQVGAGIAIEKTPHVLIEVPGDGTFRVVNSKEALEGFKKLAEERFPSIQPKISPTKVKTLGEKPTGRRISPKTESAYEYVADYTPKRVVDADYQSDKAGMVGEGWFSNGHYMIKGSPPVGFGKKALETKKEPLTKETIKQVMPSMSGMSKADYMVEFHIMDSSTNSALVVSGEKMAFFDPAYMDIIKKYHPDATVYIKDDVSPMVIRKGNETVGIIMPIKGEALPTHVTDWMKETNKRIPGTEPEVEGVPPTEIGEVKAPAKNISQFTKEYREGLSEGGFIKVGGVEKAKPKVVTPGTKDISLLEFPLTPLHVADRHPDFAPILKGNIKAEQQTNHWILRYSNRFSEAFDKVEGRGVLMEILGKERSNIRDLDLMSEGKIPIPPRLKDFVPEVKSILKDIKGEIIEKKKNDFAESMSPKQKEYLEWVQGGSVGNEPVTIVAQYSYVNKKGKTITVPEHTRPLPQSTKDAVGEALKEFKEMEKWGLTDYFPHIFKGRYKYLTEEGGIIASGQTAKQAKANFQEYVESHPEVENKTFMFVNDFYDLLTVRKTLNPELVNPLEYLGTRLSRKEFFRLLSKTEGLIKEEISNAGVEDIPKVKVDMSGIASFQKGTKFSGHFMQRKTSLRGEEADPLRALLSYTFSVGRKLGLEDAKMASYAFADSLPTNMPNAKSYIKMQADNMAGRYNVIDKIFDETIGAKLGMKPFGVSRIMGAGVGLEAKLKLGYAPAKTAINRMDAVFHTMMKEGIGNYLEGKRLLLKKDPELMGRIEREGHLAGMEQLFAGEGLVGISKKQTQYWRPLGGYQRAEITNRSEGLAAGYVSGLKKFNGDKDAAWIYAIDSSNLVNGLYSIAAKPVIVRGPVLGASYQFKQFLNNRIRFMSQLTPAQWAVYIPGMVAFSGTKGALLTLKPILGISLIGIGIDEVMERLNRKAPRLHRGIWGAIGVDLSAPASWQIPTSIKDWIGVLPRDLWETGEMILKGMKNKGWTDEQINDYVKQIAPVGYNIWKGIQILSEGVTKEGTKIIYQAKDRLEGIINLAGAKSVSQSQASDSARYMNQQRQMFLEKSKVFEDKLFGSKSAEEANNTFKELVELKNIQTPQEMQDLINGLRQSAKSRMLTEEARIFLTLPKALKKEELERRGIPLKPRSTGGPVSPSTFKDYPMINSLPPGIISTRGILSRPEQEKKVKE